MVNYRNVVGQYLGLVDVMSRQQYASSFLLDLVENAPYSAAADRVKSQRRLVKKDKFCIRGHGHCDADPLSESTGQRVSWLVPVFFQLQLLYRFLCPLASLIARHPSGYECQIDVVP